MAHKACDQKVVSLNPVLSHILVGFNKALKCPLQGFKINFLIPCLDNKP